MAEQVISKRTFEKDGLIYNVKRVLDQDADVSYLECGEPEYAESDRERLEAFNRGDWYMIGVVCDIQRQTKQNWAVPPTVGQASLWGIESDSEESYLAQIEQEIIQEAEADVKILRESLNELPA